MMSSSDYVKAEIKIPNKRSEILTGRFLARRMKSWCETEEQTGIY